MNNWVEEYIGYLKAGDFEKMLTLKAEHFPNSFFKYRTLSPTTLVCLKDNWLWMSEIDRLNDTFECSLLLDNDEMLRDLFTQNENRDKFKKMGLSDNDLNLIALCSKPFDEFKNLLSKKGLHIPFSTEQQFEGVSNVWKKDMAIMNQTIRICSFSTTNESLLMWAHYANEYKGICIEYDLLEDDVRTFMQPVHYSTTRLSVKSFNDINSYTNVVASISKSIDWEYEKEWRLTYFTKSQIEGKDNHLTVPVPKAIYLGPRFELNDEELKSELQLLTKNKNIPVFQMSTHKSEYKLIRK